MDDATKRIIKKDVRAARALYKALRNAPAGKQVQVELRTGTVVIKVTAESKTAERFQGTTQDGRTIRFHSSTIRTYYYVDI